MEATQLTKDKIIRKGGNKSGVRLRRTQTQQERDANRLAQVENILIDHANGKLELNQSQVAAAKAIYDKLRPSLSSVEQTNIESQRSEAEIKADLRAKYPNAQAIQGFIDDVFGDGYMVAEVNKIATAPQQTVDNQQTPTNQH